MRLLLLLLVLPWRAELLRRCRCCWVLGPGMLGRMLLLVVVLLPWLELVCPARVNQQARILICESSKGYKHNLKCTDIHDIHTIRTKHGLMLLT
jgi:hypothetical protein